MKTAVISDTHLYKRFDRKKFYYLKNIFESHDLVILNGDFWDGYTCTFNKFINSKWQLLFPYMRDKTVYLYGNHDREKWQDERTFMFCKEAGETYRHKLPDGRMLIIQHGHLYIDQLFERITQKRVVAALSKPLYAFANIEEIVMTKTFGWRGLNMVVNGDRNKRNQMLTRAIKEISHNGDIYVLSHTHIALMDITNKHINTGSIRFGLSSYLRITDNDLEIISERY